jgi:hypothetical protein
MWRCGFGFRREEGREGGRAGVFVGRGAFH